MILYGEIEWRVVDKSFLKILRTEMLEEQTTWITASLFTVATKGGYLWAFGTRTCPPATRAIRA